MSKTNFQYYSIGRLVDLQRRLNAIFVKRRDSGQSITGIYAQLSLVERVMSARRIYW